MRNLIKKAIELSQMCDLDISLVVRDREMQKFIQYQSTSAELGTFTPAKALSDLNELAILNKNLKIYGNDDYAKLNKASIRNERNQHGEGEDDDDEEDEEAAAPEDHEITQIVEKQTSSPIKSSSRLGKRSMKDAYIMNASPNAHVIVNQQQKKM